MLGMTVPRSQASSDGPLATATILPLAEWTLLPYADEIPVIIPSYPRNAPPHRPPGGHYRVSS